MILEIVIASLISTVLFQLAQIYYYPLWAKVGLQPFLFAVAAVVIGFWFGWAEGVIFFIVYFFGGMVTGGATEGLRRRKHDEYFGRFIITCPECGHENPMSLRDSPVIGFCVNCGAYF